MRKGQQTQCPKGRGNGLSKERDTGIRTIAVSSSGAAESSGFCFGGDDVGEGSALCVGCRDFVSSLIGLTR